jgi:four helix bundle protein
MQVLFYGSYSQIQRASVSIPSNLAEGSKRNNAKEFAQFCSIAKGSAAEVETQLIIVENVYGITTSEQIEKIHEIQRMLEALTKKLRL